jgi:hypothetical protein
VDDNASTRLIPMMLRKLATFGRGGTGWFWWSRRRGFAPEGPAVGPFPTSYSAYRDAIAIGPNRYD